MKRRDEQGFTTVETLLVVVLIAIVGFTGYYVYHSQRDTKAVISSADSAVRTPVNSKTSLAISEWGVNLPLGSETGAATYKLTSDSSGQSAEINIPGSECNPMLTIVRGMASDDDPTTNADGEASAQPFRTSANAKHVADYYYSQIDSNGTICFKGEATTKGGAQGVKTAQVYGQLNAAFNGIKSSK